MTSTTETLRERLRQPGQTIRTQPCARSSGQPLAQAGDGIAERGLRCQHGAAQKLRLEDESQSLFGGQSLGRLEQL